ncbi:MAG: metal-sulfur cluster assembly factor [Candidatus Binataceae bacterium]
MEDREILEVLRQVFDPEVGINIVDLGLAYGAQATNGGIEVVMTMTTPACPMHGYLTGQVQSLLEEKFPEAESVAVRLVWEPSWGPQMMSPGARKRLGWE